MKNNYQNISDPTNNNSQIAIKIFKLTFVPLHSVLFAAISEQ